MHSSQTICTSSWHILTSFQPKGAPNPEEKEFRRYIDGKPAPLLEKNPQTGNLQPLNWRWDPDLRYPTPYNKFFRFDGPYFSPHKAQYPFKWNEFYLPRSAVLIWKYYTTRYNQVEENFINTGRLPVRDKKKEEEHQAQQKVIKPSCSLLPFSSLLISLL